MSAAAAKKNNSDATLADTVDWRSWKAWRLILGLGAAVGLVLGALTVLADLVVVHSLPLASRTAKELAAFAIVLLVVAILAAIVQRFSASHGSRMSAKTAGGKGPAGEILGVAVWVGLISTLGTLVRNFLPAAFGIAAVTDSGMSLFALGIAFGAIPFLQMLLPRRPADG